MLQQIEYGVDGVTLTGWLASPQSSGRAPGVLVAHEATGVNDHVKRRAESLASQGYAAFVLDLYGECGFPIGEVMARHEAMLNAPGLMFRRAQAALEVLASQPGVDRSRLAAIGFCQGGTTALELARGRAPIKCAVGFHPGLAKPNGSPTNPIDAKILILVGDADPIAPESLRHAFAIEMNQAGADWQLHVFGNVSHAFTDPWVDTLNAPGLAYNADASDRSWKMMLNLFDECL